MRRFGLLLLFPVIFASSCSKPGPEKVLRQFLLAVSSGDCEKAQDLSCDALTDLLQGSIDAGCPAYTLKIVNINCSISRNEAYCCGTFRSEPDFVNGVYTYPRLQDGHDWTMIYSMKQVDDEWKLARVMQGGEMLRFEEIGGLDLTEYEPDMFRQTPRDVVALYEKYLSAGDCRKARQLTTDNARDDLAAISDAGCQPLKRMVTGIKCNDMKGYISCKCEFKKNGRYDYQTYILKSSGSGWKIHFIDGELNK